MAVIDLSTTYLGMRLRNPLVPSASPLGANLDSLRRLEAAGAAAVVLPSLFEEQIVHEEIEIARLLVLGADSQPEAGSYFPELEDYNTGPSGYLRHLEAAKRALSIPVIASLNGATEGGWTHHARLLEDAGADALELNVYLVAADPHLTSADIEHRYVDLVGAVASEISIPLAVKVAPYFTSLANMAARLVGAGARGLVLFNRFVQPEIDLEERRVVTRAHLSSPEEVRLPLRWISILRDQVDVSLAASSGVHGAAEVLKLLLAGADVTMMASALLERGPEYVGVVLGEVEEWLDAHDYHSVEQARGSMSQRSVPDPSTFARVQYMRALTTYAPSYGSGMTAGPD